MDMHEAKARADAGISSSAEHAEAVEPGWQERAIHLVTLYAAWTNKEFTMEMAREFVEPFLPTPPDLRAWGSVTQSLVRRNIIEPVGFARAASSNASFKRTYRYKGGA